MMPCVSVGHDALTLSEEVGAETTCKAINRSLYILMKFDQGGWAARGFPVG